MVPNLGVVKKPQGDGFVVADIPGLIEGASDGLGLGHEFLRHVQRCKLLLHIVDISKDDSLQNYEKINKELEKFDSELSKREQILVLNKSDLIDFDYALEIEKEFRKKFNITNNSYIISTATQNGIKELLNHLYIKLDEIEDIKINLDIEEDLEAFDNDDSDFVIEKLNKNTYIIYICV